MSAIERIEALLSKAKNEDIRLKAGIKCAAPKLRDHLIELRKLCDEGRKDALERRKAIRPRGLKKEEDELEPDIESEDEVAPSLTAEAEPAPEPVQEAKAQPAAEPTKNEPVKAKKARQPRKARA